MTMELRATEEFEPLPAGLRAFRADWGIVLGSGLAKVVEQADVTLIVPYSDIPDLPESRVPGHAGQLALGSIAGTRIAVAQGRAHLYEGHTAEAVTAGVRLLAKLGVKHLILTNAAGTLNELHPPGAWMMLSDHLNLTGTSPLLGAPNFLDMTEVYSRRLRTRFSTAAQNAGMPLYEGVYAGLLGPQYETPAEIRMLSRLGADAVGMSTVLEAIQARALGMDVVAFSCLTNWAAGLAAEPLSHEEVLATGKSAADAFCALLERALAGGAE
jgi:purine-nucleoside phosphorylase